MVNARLLDWDSDVLGLRVARIDESVLNEAQLKDALASLRHDGVDCVYWASKSDDTVTQDAADICHGVLADIKTTYELSLGELMPACDDDVVEYEDVIAMPDLIALAFEIGENSRFYLDKNMPSDAYQKVYCRWMENSVNRSIADCVKVIKMDGAVIGVVTLTNKGKFGQIDLIGVDPSYRGQGLATKLINASLAWCKEQGHSRCEVVTQFSNEAACALYEKSGFTVKGTEHFYHFWLNK